MSKRWSSELLPVQLQKLLIPIFNADEPLALFFVVQSGLET